MLVDVYAGGGALLAKGSMQIVSRELGQQLVGDGRALDLEGVTRNFDDLLAPLVAGVDTDTPGVIFPRGTFVRDATGLVVSQSDGAGGYVALGGGGDLVTVSVAGVAGRLIGV